MRYYFDLRQGDETTRDDEGMEFPSIELVQEEAARFLAELALLVDPKDEGAASQLSIEVRDENGNLVLQACFDFTARPTVH
jgi:hypothetical protein